MDRTAGEVGASTRELVGESEHAAAVRASAMDAAKYSGVRFMGGPVLLTGSVRPE
jgi:hypothetical protein